MQGNFVVPNRVAWRSCCGFQLGRQGSSGVALQPHCTPTQLLQCNLTQLLLPQARAVQQAKAEEEAAKAAELEAAAAEAEAGDT